MKWGVRVAALAGALGCAALDLGITPARATGATSSWLESRASSSHCASTLTDSGRYAVASLGSSDRLTRPVKQLVVRLDRLDALQVNANASEPHGLTCSTSVLRRKTVEGRDLCRDAARRTYTVRSPDTCEFKFGDALDQSGQDPGIAVESTGASICRVRAQADGTPLQDERGFDPSGAE